MTRQTRHTLLLGTENAACLGLTINDEHDAVAPFLGLSRMEEAMGSQQRKIDVSVNYLCINCLAVLDLLERLVEAAHVQSSVETCAGCQRTACKTYRFHVRVSETAA